MWLASRKFAITTLLLEIAFILTYGFLVKFDYEATPKLTSSSLKDEAIRPLMQYYPMFQDIHIMVFVGFGFLYTFLRKYGYSAVGYNFFISALVIQWAILCEGFLSPTWKSYKTILLDIKSLITADVAAAAVLISWGAVLGKTSPLQLLIMAMCEVPLYALNEWIIAKYYIINDPGSSMTCHMFGGYFGLAVSFMLYKKYYLRHPNENSSKTSDVFSMIGTIFLWAFWPSFNAALLYGDMRYRAVINTYLSLTASCIMTFIVSSIFNRNGKFNMVHAQNATLAGGVAIGSVCNVILAPYGALLTGSIAGLVCTLGFKYSQLFLARRLRLHDTCGIHYLHAISGLISGIIGAILAAMAEMDTFGFELFVIYPARFPVINSLTLTEDSRSASLQAAYQVYTFLTTLGIALIGGLITGMLIRWSWLDSVDESKCYEDSHWDSVELEDGHEMDNRSESQIQHEHAHF